MEVTAAPNNNTRSRGWCFTHNNYEEEHINFYMATLCKYVIVGKEVAPTTNTPHLQGYIYFDNAKSFQWVKRVFPHAHLTPARGTTEQNYEYCKKGGDFLEAGTKPLSQAEKGLKGKEAHDAMWQLAIEGDYFKLPPQSIKTWEYIHMKYGPKPQDRPELINFWIYGRSGCGKSRYVRENYPSLYNKPMSKWWDGYAGEDAIVLDDFSPEHAKYLGYYVKIWTDHYTFNADIKGTMVNIRPAIVIITSQYTIEQCFTEDPKFTIAISRRFTVVKLAPEDGEADLTAQQYPPVDV